MYSWRISKYNPKYRDDKGFYQKEEWTAYSDIGKYFGGSLLTFEEYLATETSYISSIQLFLEFLGISRLQIFDLEKYGDHLDNQDVDEFATIYNAIHKNDILEKKQLDVVYRLALREYLWCKLENDEFFIHFGYDYYMYIGCSQMCTEIIEKLSGLGLFVEEIQSPYSN